MSTIYIHKPDLPYDDRGAFGPEPEEKVFENPCPICGLSLDYEGDIKDMCNCN